MFPRLPRAHGHGRRVALFRSSPISAAWLDLDSSALADKHRVTTSRGTPVPLQLLPLLLICALVIFVCPVPVSAMQVLVQAPRDLPTPRDQELERRRGAQEDPAAPAEESSHPKAASVLQGGTSHVEHQHLQERDRVISAEVSAAGDVRGEDDVDTEQTTSVPGDRGEESESYTAGVEENSLAARVVGVSVEAMDIPAPAPFSLVGGAAAAAAASSLVAERAPGAPASPPKPVCRRFGRGSFGVIDRQKRGNLPDAVEGNEGVNALVHHFREGYRINTYTLTLLHPGNVCQIAELPSSATKQEYKRLRLDMAEGVVCDPKTHILVRMHPLQRSHKGDFEVG